MLNTGLSDNSIQILASGLEQSQQLIYLDMRKNTFERDGFRELARSLIGLPSLLTLRLNAIQIEGEELQILSQLFGHPDCAIQHLELEELEVQDKRSQGVIEAVSLIKNLFTFDFSNNQLP